MSRSFSLSLFLFCRFISRTIIHFWLFSKKKNNNNRRCKRSTRHETGLKMHFPIFQLTSKMHFSCLSFLFLDDGFSVHPKFIVVFYHLSGSFWALDLNFAFDHHSRTHGQSKNIHFMSLFDVDSVADLRSIAQGWVHGCRLSNWPDYSIYITVFFFVQASKMHFQSFLSVLVSI